MNGTIYDYKGITVLVPMDGRQLLIKMDEEGNYLSALDLAEARDAIDRFLTTGCWYYYH